MTTDATRPGRAQPRIVAVDPDAADLERVIALWGKSRSTLGLMPRGGFVEAAQQGRLLAAVDETQSIRAYLLFRISRDAAWIVHLCVDETARGQGLARSLVGHLRQRMNGRRGIGLRCRSDFQANKVWPRLDFVPLHETAGRAGKPLTQWWLDFGKATLFSGADQRLASERTVVAIDANVFFDLYDNKRPAAQESCVLLADWLDDVLIAVTDEIFTDISRLDDPAARDTWRTRAAKHHALTCGADEIDDLLPQVESVVFAPHSDRDQSDLRHLVRCAATGTGYFITRDARILERREGIERELGVVVCRPIDFALRMDRAERGDAYRPIDLSGTLLRERPLNEGERDDLVEAFQNSRAPERKPEFLARLRGVAQVRGPGECRVITDSAAVPLAMWGTVPVADAVLRVELLRARPHPADHTIARHVIHHVLRRARASGMRLVLVTDTACQESVITGLEAEGFVRCSTTWAHALVAPGITIPLAREQLTRLADSAIDAAPALRGVRDALVVGSGNTGAVLSAERSLWPARFPELDLPCFILPIQPRWAQHLFDADLARGTLFGADPDLMLNREAVYYRSKRRAGLAAPARMLWYVSKGAGEPGGMALTAMSYIDEIVVGPATKLFRRFRRLGVYEWRDVRETGGGESHGDVMAVRFSGTEPLARRLPRREFQPILRAHHVRTTLVSPTRIPKAAFEQIVLAAEGVG